MSAPSAAAVTAVIDRLHATSRDQLATATDAKAAYERAINQIIADRARDEALTDLRALTEARRTADTAWRLMVAAAVAMGAPSSEVAAIAGITPAYARQLARDTIRAQREEV